MLCYLAAFFFLTKDTHFANLFEWKWYFLIINEKIMAFEENPWFGERISKAYV